MIDLDNTRIQECTKLAEEILADFQTRRIPVDSILLKALRLYSLLGDQFGITLFTYETSGYPLTPTGMPQNVWVIAEAAGRTYAVQNPMNPAQLLYYSFPMLLSELQAALDAEKSKTQQTANTMQQQGLLQMQTAFSVDPTVQGLPDSTATISSGQRWMQTIRSRLYQYVLQTYQYLKYGSAAEGTFTEFRMQADERLKKICPKAIEKLSSAYNNLNSSNQEDWANAVHSCRRILTDLADALYPPRDEPVIVDGKPVKVGKDQYINRLVQFIASKAGSKTFADVVGADLSSIGMRLDAIYDAVCKGTHAEITKDEASRYIIHTYLLISDIVSLTDQ